MDPNAEAKCKQCLRRGGRAICRGACSKVFSFFSVEPTRGFFENSNNERELPPRVPRARRGSGAGAGAAAAAPGPAPGPGARPFGPEPGARARNENFFRGMREAHEAAEREAQPQPQPQVRQRVNPFQRMREEQQQRAAAAAAFGFGTGVRQERREAAEDPLQRAAREADEAARAAAVHRRENVRGRAVPPRGVFGTGPAGAGAAAAASEAPRTEAQFAENVARRRAVGQREAFVMPRGARDPRNRLFAQQQAEAQAQAEEERRQANLQERIRQRREQDERNLAEAQARRQQEIEEQREAQQAAQQAREVQERSEDRRRPSEGAGAYLRRIVDRDMGSTFNWEGATRKEARKRVLLWAARGGAQNKGGNPYVFTDVNTAFKELHPESGGKRTRKQRRSKRKSTRRS